MRTLKTSVLLAATALLSIAIFLALLVDGEAAEAARQALPDTLACYEETIQVGSEGNAEVEIRFVLDRGGVEGLLLPFDFEGATDFTVISGPAGFGEDSRGLRTPTVKVLGRRMLNLESAPGSAAGDTVRVGAFVPGWFSREESARPYSEYGVNRRFTNTSTYVLQDVRLRVVLPAGFLVHDVDFVIPAYEPKKNPNPPYSIERYGDRIAMIQRAESLAPAEVVELSFGMRSGKRGKLPLGLGLVLAALHLAFFRDQLKPREEK